VSQSVIYHIPGLICFKQTCFLTVRTKLAGNSVTDSVFADGIAASMVLSVANYVILGLGIQTDGYYLHSFEVFLAIIAVFPGLGNLGYILLEYRLGYRRLLDICIETATWIPFLFVSPLTALI